jgi:NAD(P)-dependent dehydrogenase (short-subunit alcohol dehydrogenase family)
MARPDDESTVFAAAAALGPVHVLVNNAGIVSGKRLLDLSPEDIERTFRVNTLAHFWTLQAFLPAMIARDAGHVVTIASAAGFCAPPCSPTTRRARLPPSPWTLRGLPCRRRSVTHGAHERPSSPRAATSTTR